MFENDRNKSPNHSKEPKKIYKNAKTSYINQEHAINSKKIHKNLKKFIKISKIHKNLWE